MTQTIKEPNWLSKSVYQHNFGFIRIIEIKYNSDIKSFKIPEALKTASKLSSNNMISYVSIIDQQ